MIQTQLNKIAIFYLLVAMGRLLIKRLRLLQLSTTPKRDFNALNFKKSTL